MAAKAPAKRYFECEEDGSSKFWEVWTEGGTLKTRFGKIGSGGQIKLKDFSDAAGARAELDKLVKEKTKKGYREASGGQASGQASGGQASGLRPQASGPEPSGAKSSKAKGASAGRSPKPEARSPASGQPDAALAAAIDADPYDRNAWMVLADWYQSQGDPRGELMALQIGNKHKPAKKFLDEHVAELLGPLAAHQKVYDHDRDDDDPKKSDTFLWRNGFIFDVRLSHNQYADSGFKGKLAKDVLGPLLDHPSGRFITEMRFQDNDDPSDDDLQDLVDLLAKKAPKTIRRIEIGDAVDQISWYQVGDISKLWKAVPNLRTFHIEAGSFKLGKIEAPALKEAIFKTGGLSTDSGMAIAKAVWPNIAKLHVYYGDDNYGGDCSIKQVQPLLDRTDLVNLKELGLMNSQFADDICKALPRAKILAGLEILDLSLGCMTGEGALALAEHPAAFAHLKEIRVEDNYIGEAGGKALKKAFGRRVTGVDDQQGDEEDEYRSPSVAE